MKLKTYSELQWFPQPGRGISANCFNFSIYNLHANQVLTAKCFAIYAPDEIQPH